MVTLVVGEARAEGYLYSCNTIEIKKLDANGNLPDVDASQQFFGTAKKIFFDEASGIMRDGISTSNMKIIQRGTADNSLVAIDVYQGAGDSGADVFRVSTWEEKMPFLYLRTSSDHTRTLSGWLTLELSSNKKMLEGVEKTFLVFCRTLNGN
jgi:hypothetical protein